MPLDPPDRESQVRESEIKDARTFRSMMAQAARFSEIAFIIPAGIVVGYLLGALLNHWFHAPWLVIVGVVVGVIAGFTQMIRRAVSLSK